MVELHVLASWYRRGQGEHYAAECWTEQDSHTERESEISPSRMHRASRLVDPPPRQQMHCNWPMNPQAPEHHSSEAVEGP